jgi:uncharacterized protein YdcH (DUF465 family)
MSTGACLRATTAQGKADDAHLARLVVERNQLASDLQATVDGAVQGAPLDTSHAETLLVRYNALMREISG